ncbi:hypothetical protein [Kribbella endophytica]
MPYVLKARSGPGNLWVMRDHPGQPEYGDYLGADGESLYDLIADGRVEDLGFTPRFTRSNSGKPGDLLWTTGDMAKLASRRFVDVLEAVGATGYRTFPVEVRGKRGEPIGDYVGFAVLDADPEKDLRFELWYQGWSFVASDRVADALKAAGVTELSVKRLKS